MWMCIRQWRVCEDAGAHSMFQTGLRFGWQRCCNIHNSLGKCNEVKCHNISHRSASLHFWQPNSAHWRYMCVCVCVFVFIGSIFSICLYFVWERASGQKKKEPGTGEAKQAATVPPVSSSLTFYIWLLTEGERRKLEIVENFNRQCRKRFISTLFLSFSSISFPSFPFLQSFLFLFLPSLPSTLLFH